ncbi:hypothetical protein [Fluviicola sp.]|jgi:hypothetical protein|uniref:hypothetical protein n=1 Tax=Fluviicola sp. TaxID=1917219 RepID=UPI00281CBEC7|nr:hypothetical protein [Fluviicola sp.]MDR0802301.1 hypothetical protein [Fluviicola sp.]
MKNSKINSLNLESLKINDFGLLVGGFSQVAKPSLSDNSIGLERNKDCITTNNCSGANCRMGCGETQLK